MSAPNWPDIEAQTPGLPFPNHLYPEECSPGACFKCVCNQRAARGLMVGRDFTLGERRGSADIPDHHATLGDVIWGDQDMKFDIAIGEHGMMES